MADQRLTSLTEHDKEILIGILEEQAYPRSVKEIRSLLRTHGLQYPEYLITRALRELISEGKARHKAGRWTSPGLQAHLKAPGLGYAPTPIRPPTLSQEGQNTLGQTGKTVQFTEEEQLTADDRGSWGLFRRLLRYYSECVRDEGGADASSFLDRLGKQFVFINGTGNWFPRTGETWTYILPLGEHIADFQQELTRGQENSVVVFGYPIEAFSSKSSDGDYTIIRPIFYYLLDTKFGNGSICFKSANSQPEISPEWLKYALKSYSEQFHFLSACGLLNQGRSLDGAPGFTSDDIRPSLDDLTRTLSGFLPRRIREPLDPRSVPLSTGCSGLKSGIYNRAVIMLSGRTKYTQTLLKELKHIENQPAEILEKTSLRHVFKENVNGELHTGKDEIPHEALVAELLPLNVEQREATASLLKDNVSVVTGPPGTGKSQVVVSAVSNARLFEQTVLFTSRNHKAIDAVCKRARDRNDQPIISRANSRSDPNVNYSFSTAVRDLLANTLDVEDTLTFSRKLKLLQQRLSERGKTARLAAGVQTLRDQIGAIEQDLAWLDEQLDEKLTSHLKRIKHVASIKKLEQMSDLLTWILKSGETVQDANWHEWLRQWLRMVSPWLRLKRQARKLPTTFKLPVILPMRRERLIELDVAVEEKAIRYILLNERLVPLERKIALRSSLDALVSELSGQNEKINGLADELLALHLQTTGGLLANSEFREHIASLRVALNAMNRSFDSVQEQAQVQRELEKHIPLLLKNFPSWAVTNLSIGSRIPLVPGIFDLAIVDEASQCDIASAIPVLYRAKRAGVVGDPHQLKHVHKLTIGKDSIFRKRAELSGLKDQRFSYRETSLYDLFAQTNSVTQHMLRETYRSCDGIAGYSNEVFYKGQLRVATDESKLVLPSGTKSGIHWTDVEGTVRSAGKSGCLCEEEIEAVYELIETLLVKNNFRGSIGVVTPFRIQANRLNDRIFEGDIPYAQLTNAQVVIDTSHGFQGDEKDVMIFSLCGGRDMPQGSRFFLRDSANLFNVAVSRARAVLLVVGNREWAANSSIPHIVALALPEKEKVFTPDRSPWAPYESPWEENLAEALEAKGMSPIPQYPVAGRRLDLALIDKSRSTYLDIEVDGDLYHRNPDGSRKKDDLWRDITIQGRGWRVMRFWVYRLKEHMNECVAEIEAAWKEHDNQD